VVRYSDDVVIAASDCDEAWEAMRVASEAAGELRMVFRRAARARPTPAGVPAGCGGWARHRPRAARVERSDDGPRRHRPEAGVVVGERRRAAPGVRVGHRGRAARPGGRPEVMSTTVTLRARPGIEALPRLLGQPKRQAPQIGKGPGEHLEGLLDAGAET
jgi:hypothetical protein